MAEIFFVGDTVRIIMGDPHRLGKTGIIKSITTDVYNEGEVQKFLVEGADMSGAVLRDDEGNTSVSNNSRYYYDFMVEKVN